jgi:hypothetical protein
MAEPTPTFHEVARQFFSRPPEEIQKRLDWLEKNNPEGYKKLNQYAQANKGMLDEAKGYEWWLRKFGPHTFTGTFSFFHHDFWKWYWPIAMRVREGTELQSDDLVALLPWARDTGKSSHSEWAAITEGCLVRRGYVLWVSSKQEQAEEHIVSIRDRIESEQIGKVYPWMSKPKLGAHNNKFGWGREFLMTGDPRGGGWAVRPAGLNVALRGGKVLDMRPTLIVLSDIDEIGDSIMVVESKELIIARSILPMGNASTRIIFDQNPIHSNSVMNRIITRVSSVLAVRRVIGGGGADHNQPVPAFKEDLQIEFEQTEHGPRHIIKKGTPTWADMDIKKCQVFLDRSGLEAFQAEYMHDLTATEEERVLPEYDDRVTRANVITWSQFESKYGMRRIPSDWVCDVGLDIGYSTGHRSGWTFLARAPQIAELSGSVFRYRGRSFQAVGIDEQSIAIRATFWPGESTERHFMSHEKLGERMVLNSKHGWHFQPCDSAKTAGLAQWRHLLTCDHHKPHPFHRDERDPNTSLWKIGCPAWFDVVADDQFFSPIDDYGLKRHRDGAFNWRRRPVKHTESGLTVDEPIKRDDDESDSTRMLLAGGTFGPAELGLTPAQKVQAAIPSGYTKAELAKRTDMPPDQQAMTGEFALWLAQRTVNLKKPAPSDDFGQSLPR